MTRGFRLLGAIFLGLLLLSPAARATEDGDDGVDPEKEPRWWGYEDSGPAVSFPYIYEPVGSWVYDEVERQVALGNLSGLYHHSRLLPRSLIAARVAAALGEGKRSVGLLRLARELAWEGRMMGLDLPFEDTRPWITLGPPTSQVKFNGFLSLGGRFEDNEDPVFADLSTLGLVGTYWHPSGFGMFADFAVTETEDAARFGSTIFEDTEVQVNARRFGAAWHSRFLELWFGRANLKWGPGRAGGLLVGAGSDPYGQLGYRIHLGTFLTATAVHGWLSQAEKRFVAFHRVEMNLGKFRLGVAEGARYDAAAPEPYYLINLLPYSATVEQLLTAEGSKGADRDSLFRSNYIFSTDVYWNWSPGWATYGELMIDDILRENGFFDTKPESGVPIRIGYQLGAVHVREGSRRLTLQVEYTRIYNYTYSTWYNRDFFHRDDPLGYPLGPDTSDLNLWVDLDLDLDWTLKGQLYHQRVGEGNTAGPWCPEDQPNIDRFGTECQTVGEASGSRFAGVVERRVGLELGAAFAPRDNLRFEAQGGIVLVDNADHIEGDNETRPVGRVLASWRW